MPVTDLAAFDVAGRTSSSAAADQALQPTAPRKADLVDRSVAGWPEAVRLLWSTLPPRVILYVSGAANPFRVVGVGPSQEFTVATVAGVSLAGRRWEMYRLREDDPAPALPADFAWRPAWGAAPTHVDCLFLSGIGPSNARGGDDPPSHSHPAVPRGSPAPRCWPPGPGSRRPS